MSAPTKQPLTPSFGGAAAASVGVSAAAARAASLPSEPESLTRSLDLSRAEQLAIADLLRQSDPRVIAAYRAYPGIQFLVDAFLRLAERYAAASSSRSPRQQPQSGLTDRQAPSATAASGMAAGRSAGEAPSVSPSDGAALMLQLLNKKLITRREYQALSNLCKRGHPLVSAARAAAGAACLSVRV